MTLLKLAFRNATHDRRAAAATAACIAVIVAVLAGALTVGDSVRGSLRHLALDRLGPYDELLLTEQPFRAALADELAARPGFRDHFTAAVPVLVLRGTVEHSQADGTRRVSNVTIVGCDEAFWASGGHTGFDPPRLMRDEAALNSALATPLAASAGDTVLLRIGRAGPIPADSPLGQKQRSETVASQELRVAAVVPNRGLGGFTLSPSQQEAPCAFVALTTLQRLLEQPGRANAILVAGRLDAESSADAARNAASAAGNEWLKTNLRPKLEDFGLTLRQIVIGDPTKPVTEYFQLTSQRMLLPLEVQRAAERTWRGQTVQPVLTYLANALGRDGKEIPYSTISAVDSVPRIGPLLNDDGSPLTMDDDQIVLIDWAAEDLKAKPGDIISATCFEPETTHGEPHEQTVQLKLKAVVPLAEAGSPPRLTNDPDLTPELKGVTDSESIDKWRVPFKLTRTIRPPDDQYWTDHRTTPKAYVSLATGQKLWRSRFGDLTSLRVAPAAGKTVDSLSQALAAEFKPARLGMEFRPVRQEALAAAAGTTPLDVLFLLFSFFLIAAVLMLLTVLFRLGVDERANEIGLLLASGLRQGQITRLLVAEGLLAALPGALVGMLLGIGYAWLILAGLREGWLSSIAAPKLELYWTLRGLLLGAAVGLVVAGVTIYLAVQRIGRIPVRQLLAGVALPERGARGSIGAASRRRSGGLIGIVLMLGLSGLMAIGSAGAAAETQAGLFFVSGALALFAGLMMARRFLVPLHRTASQRHISLLWLAARNARLNPGRSLLCIALVAAVSFLLIATSTFRLDVSDSGSGGFDLLAESPLPILHDLGTSHGRAELGLSEEEDRLLRKCTMVPLRVQDGDDASCLNLYRPRQPRILGVPRTLAYHAKDASRFAWGSAFPISQGGAEPAAESFDPHLDALTRRNWPYADDAIPVVIDENTARYSLGLRGQPGEILTIENASGQKTKLLVVALLRNSIFQGDLLISEENLLKLFPDTRGYRYFLIRTPPGQRQAVADLLEDRLGDFGLDVTPARERLAALLAVQNTYLSTFQSFGALGLMLGTLGLAAVQLRSVQQRRGELALLRAAGFGRRRITTLVLFEITTVMVAGLGLGAAAALLAVWPHLWSGAASFPWAPLGGMLLAVVACGVVAGTLAALTAVRDPLIAALRGA